MTWFLVCDQGSLVGLYVQDYKSVCAAVTVCSTLVNMQTHTDSILTSLYRLTQEPKHQLQETINVFKRNYQCNAIKPKPRLLCHPARNQMRPTAQLLGATLDRTRKWFICASWLMAQKLEICP